jgi:ubiquitin-like 1-activating enzyme E1 B
VIDAAQELGLKGDLTINEGNRLLYDADFDSNLSKTFKQLNLRSGMMLLVGTDDDDGLENVALLLKHE